MFFPRDKQHQFLPDSWVQTEIEIIVNRDHSLTLYKHSIERRRKDDTMCDTKETLEEIESAPERRKSSTFMVNVAKTKVEKCVKTDISVYTGNRTRDFILL